MAGGLWRPKVAVRIMNKGLSGSSAEAVEFSSRHSSGVVINCIRKIVRESPRVCNRIVDLHCSTGTTSEVVAAEDIHLPAQRACGKFLTGHRHMRPHLPCT